MNDFSELEAELKQLRPAAPSAELATRVERAMQKEGGQSAKVDRVAPRAIWAWLERKMRFGLGTSKSRAERTIHQRFALGLGLVGATAAFFFLARTNVDRPAASPRMAETKRPSPTAINAGPSLLPDGVTRVVYHTSDEGLVQPANATEPARRFRSRSRETLQWRDPGSGASLRVSYPTEEVELIPVSISGQ